MANFQSYTLPQSQQITINTPRPVAAIGGDNPTPFYLFFPTMPFGQQWVFPFVYGFLYPLPEASFSSVIVDSSRVPAGAQTPAAGSTALANLVAYQASDLPPTYSAGTPSISSTILRWNINSVPGTGNKASATRAATPGVIHIADSFIMRIVTTGAAVAGAIQVSIIDGPSGGTTFLMTTGMGITATAGQSDSESLGPGLNYRGTAGSAITIEFAAAAANTAQAVSLTGYDQ